MPGTNTSGHDIVQHSLHRFRPSRRISARVEKKISEWPVLITVLDEQRKKEKKTSTLSMSGLRVPARFVVHVPYIENAYSLAVFGSGCITDYVFG